MSNINIMKRDGTKEPLDVNKIHKVVEFACEGLTGVSSSQVEMSSHIQFYDGMTSSEIQEIMIKSANDLISLEVSVFHRTGQGTRVMLALCQSG